MVTTLDCPVLEASNVSSRVKPPGTVPYQIGKQIIRVPCSVLDVTEYPLFGIQYDCIYMPRRDRWPDVFTWLAVELRETRDAWPLVWARCQLERPSLWHTYIVVTLTHPSRDLPAGDVVFQVETDFLQIPGSDLDYLPTHQQSQVKQCFVDAMRDFPNDQPLEILRPLFSGTTGVPRLATANETRCIAQSRHDELQLICSRKSARIKLSSSSYHYEKAWREYEQLRSAAVQRTVKVTGRNRLGRLLVPGAVENEVTSLMPVAEKLGLTVTSVRLSLTAEVLHIIDPVMVIEERTWRLPEHSTELRFLRLVAHWDDHGVNRF